MGNLEKLAEEMALLEYPRVINDPYNPMEDDNKENRDIFIKGFLAHEKYQKMKVGYPQQNLKESNKKKT